MTAEFLFSQLSMLFRIKCVELWAKTGFLFDDGLLPSTLEPSPMICSLTLHWLLTFFSLFFLIFSSESHFLLHLSADHAKPLIEMAVEGAWERRGWRLMCDCGSGCQWLPQDLL